MDINNDKISEYKSQSKHKLTFIVSIMVLIITIILDFQYSDQLMNISIEITYFLQQNYDLKILSFFFSYVAFFSIFAYVFLIFTISKNPESSFALILGFAFFLYLQAILKLLYKDPRPVMLSEKLNGDYCICDYGKPSGHSMSSVGMLLLIYSQIRFEYSPSRCFKIFLKIFFGSLVFMIMFSRLYLGVHSINQIFLGFIWGVTVFYFLKRYRDSILKYLIWPIFYKERFRSKNAIAFLFFIMIFLNYILFVTWAYVFTNYEYPDMSFIKFKNCNECYFLIENVAQNFSTKSLREALAFNLYFGMLFGIFLSKQKNFKYKGLLADGSKKKYFVRLLVLLVFAGFIIFAYYPKINFNLLAIARAGVFCFLSGILFTSIYFWTLKKLGLDFEMEEIIRTGELENVVVGLSKQEEEYNREVKGGEFNGEDDKGEFKGGDISLLSKS